MSPKLLRRLGVACVALVLAGTGCGSGGGSPTQTSPGGNATTGAGGNGATATYAVKADLCAEADLAPLKAVLPVVDNLKVQGKTLNGSPVFYCDGNAAKTDQYKDIGFFGLAAYNFGSAEDASHQYDSATGPTRATDVQPISGLGQKAVSYLDGREVCVSVLDGTFYFKAYWVSNSTQIPASLRDEVRQGLVATTKATMAKLRTT